MIVFYTKQTEHLAKQLPFERGYYRAHFFSDGELNVQLDTEINNSQVWVIGAIFPPAQQALELFFLLDALQRAGARITLMLTYFGYARQDRAAAGDAKSVEVICNFLKTFKLAKIFVIHPHSSLLHSFLEFHTIMPTELIAQHLDSFDAVAAPDAGARALVHTISQQYYKEVIFLNKMRPEKEKVEILTHEGDAQGRKILLIDDMITTGSTLVAAANRLQELGASEVSAWATHGIFTSGAVERIANSRIKKLYVTNTLLHDLPHGTIEVVDIAPVIAKLIQ